MKRTSINRLFIWFMLILFGMVLIYSIYNIFNWYIDGKNNKKIEEEIKKIIVEDESVDDLNRIKEEI